ncbi:MAG: DUF3090 family protein [Actinomycetes bacterium]
MPRRVFEYDRPDRFVAGTVGEPGQRTFYLQVRSGPRLTSVALEKAQVAALAERLTDLLDTLLRRSGAETSIPALVPVDALDLDPLDGPVEEEFRVGSMSLEWDEDTECFVLEAFAVVDDDEPDLDDLEALDSDDSGPDKLRVVLDGPEARRFAERAERVVAAGRPPCPFCNQPLDPQGHICPRQNGHRRRP